MFYLLGGSQNKKKTATLRKLLLLCHGQKGPVLDLDSAKRRSMVTQLETRRGRTEKESPYVLSRYQLYSPTKLRAQKGRPG